MARANFLRQPAGNFAAIFARAPRQSIFAAASKTTQHGCTYTGIIRRSSSFSSPSINSKAGWVRRNRLCIPNSTLPWINSILAFDQPLDQKSGRAIPDKIDASGVVLQRTGEHLAAPARHVAVLQFGKAPDKAGFFAEDGVADFFNRAAIFVTETASDKAGLRRFECPADSNCSARLGPTPLRYWNGVAIARRHSRTLGADADVLLEGSKAAAVTMPSSVKTARRNPAKLSLRTRDG